MLNPNIKDKCSFILICFKLSQGKSQRYSISLYFYFSVYSEENIKTLYGFIPPTPLSHRPKQGANFAWGQQSGAWERAGNANLLGVKAALLGVGLSLPGVAFKFLGERAFSYYI